MADRRTPAFRHAVGRWLCNSEDRTAIFSTIDSTDLALWTGASGYAGCADYAEAADAEKTNRLVASGDSRLSIADELLRFHVYCLRIRRRRRNAGSFDVIAADCGRFGSTSMEWGTNQLAMLVGAAAGINRRNHRYHLSLIHI